MHPRVFVRQVRLSSVCLPVEALRRWRAHGSRVCVVAGVDDQRVRHLITGVSGRALRAATRGGEGPRRRCPRSWCGSGSRNQADGAAADAERIGHRSQCSLGRLAIDGPRANPDDQGAVMLATDTWTCRPRLHPDSDPHADSIDVQSRSVGCPVVKAGGPLPHRSGRARRWPRPGTAPECRRWPSRADRLRGLAPPPQRCGSRRPGGPWPPHGRIGGGTPGRWPANVAAHIRQGAARAHGYDNVQ